MLLSPLTHLEFPPLIFPGYSYHLSDLSVDIPFSRECPVNFWTITGHSRAPRYQLSLPTVPFALATIMMRLLTMYRYLKSVSPT